jgi:hypothetical protein
MTSTPDEAAASIATDEPAPSQPDSPEAPASIDTKLVRELALVTDQLKAREGEVAELKARKRELSEQLLGTFELHGMDQMRVAGRLAYVHRPSYARYLDKPADQGGGRYTPQDAVAVLRQIGRGAQVQPETVNHQTMGAILREYRDSKQPLPEALARIVELDEKPEVRIGAPRK